MDLKEIIIKSKGVLSNAELNFYLSYCAFADDQGFCFPKMKTVAEMRDFVITNASRMFKQLTKLEWLAKENGGVLCRIGFGKSYQGDNSEDENTDKKTYQEDKKSYQEDNLLPPDPASTSYQGDNKTYQEDNSSYQGDNSTINKVLITNQLTNQLNKKDMSVPEVFQHWQTQLKHSKAKLDKTRERIIKTRLKDFSAAELCQAIDGVLLSPFHLGENDSKTKYTDLKTIFRDVPQVEKFIGLSEAAETLNKKGDEKNGNSFTRSDPNKPAGSTGSTNGSTQTGAGSNPGKYRHTAGANPIIIE